MAKHFRLSSGDQIPAIGLGTWKMDPATAESAVASAIRSGYRHIDCAWIYENESGVGRGLASVFESDVDRNDVWVTSKLWNDCHRPEHVRGALQSTIDDLGLEYLDLYLIHWPVAHQHGIVRPQSASDYATLDEVPLAETWQAMIECQRDGLCKNIGVSNFSEKKIADLFVSTGIAPTINQVESHPLLAQNSLQQFCREQNILLTAYSPLGSGDRPDAMKKASEPNLFETDTIARIATDRGVSPAQILIAWAVCRGTVVIPKSANEDRQRDNLEAAALQLNENEMNQIAELDQHYRYVDGKFWEIDGGPYTVQNLWDGE